MADIALSSKSTTAIIAGGFVYIIIPDGGSPTGFVGRRISVTNLLAALQLDVDGNTSDITTNTTAIAALQNITARVQRADQVSNFNIPQPATSIITKIRARSDGAATMEIGTTPLGQEITEEVVSLTDGTLWELDQVIDSVAGQTIYFTITGTVSVSIYYEANTI